MFNINWGHSVYLSQIARNLKTILKTLKNIAKRIEIWDLEVLVERIWGIFNLLIFKVTLG